MNKIGNTLDSSYYMGANAASTPCTPTKSPLEIPQITNSQFIKEDSTPFYISLPSFASVKSRLKKILNFICWLFTAGWWTPGKDSTQTEPILLAEEAIDLESQEDPSIPDELQAEKDFVSIEDNNPLQLTPHDIALSALTLAQGACMLANKELGPLALVGSMLFATHVPTYLTSRYSILFGIKSGASGLSPQNSLVRNLITFTSIAAISSTPFQKTYLQTAISSGQIAHSLEGIKACWDHLGTESPLLITRNLFVHSVNALSSIRNLFNSWRTSRSEINYYQATAYYNLLPENKTTQTAISNLCPAFYALPPPLFVPVLDERSHWLLSPLYKGFNYAFSPVYKGYYWLMIPLAKC